MHLIRLLLVISFVTATLGLFSHTFLATANEMCKNLSNVNEDVIKQIFVGTIPQSSKEVMDYVFCMSRGLNIQNKFGAISAKKLKKFLLNFKVFRKSWVDRTLDICLQRDFDGRRNAFGTFTCLREQYFKQKLFEHKPYLFYLMY
ncbi:unnamed protein product [Phyllotreta striolata]|uniref:Uncharacterized protein n=1 Tax=Phyllotreta striolata TaxID=444603 RepID=A0A9N9TFM4_PHYSR|nr:unnamed protein product [Phyllotreta striolata]